MQSTTGRRCTWTHREDEGTRAVKLLTHEGEETVYVCPAHEDELRRFTTYERRFGPILPVCFGLTVLGILITAVAGVRAGVGAGLIFFGAGLIVFSFPTPQTVRLLGARKAIWLARGCGVLVIGLGLQALVEVL